MKIYIDLDEARLILASSYNGSSDLQLERMNVYFNEVHDSHGTLK